MTEKGFWENFAIQTVGQGGDLWREIIGIAKVNESFKINPQIYIKVIDNIFKEEKAKEISIG